MLLLNIWNMFSKNYVETDTPVLESNAFRQFPAASVS